MLNGSYRMPFGKYEGYSLARIIHFHSDYVEEILADEAFCKTNPNLANFFQDAIRVNMPNFDPDPNEGMPNEHSEMSEAEREEANKELKPKRKKK